MQLKKIKFAFCARLDSIACFCGLILNGREQTAAVSLKGFARGVFYIAHKSRHPSVGWAPGEYGEGGGVGAEEEVAVQSVFKAGNGKCVQSYAFFKGPFQFAGHYGNIFLSAC